MAPPDDENRDWDQDAKTELDKTVVRPVSDVITAPHDLAAIAGSLETEIAAAREDACKGCYAEGQEDMRSALRSVLLMRGLTNEETAHLVLAVWQERTRL